MYRLTRWNEQTEMAELEDWDTEEEWKEFMDDFDVPIWSSLVAAFDKLAEYEDLEEKYGDLNELKSKQNSMKYLKAYDDDVKQHWLSCPMCYKGLGWEYNKLPKYCPECGQKLKK